MSSGTLDRLRKAACSEHVAVGDAVHDHYTQDEALTAFSTTPLALVLPASTARWPTSCGWPESTGCRWWSGSVAPASREAAWRL
jgi:hypothetical protein